MAAVVYRLDMCKHTSEGTEMLTSPLVFPIVRRQGPLLYSALLPL